MLGSALVSPVGEGFREVLDAIARRRGWPSSADAEKLGLRVAELSALYNEIAAGPQAVAVAARRVLAARLAFSFPRDVPKAAAAVRELVATGALTLGADPLRVLDLGAGLGAMTWGVARALEASGAKGAIDATWIDADADALALGSEIARALPESAVVVRPKALPRRVDADCVPAGKYDLVFLGQVLSELDPGKSPDERATLHTDLCARLIDRSLAQSGSLVVVEPALRDRTRHLHRIRDGVLARGGANVFSPCLHAAPCPALHAEGDWCHEDLKVDLPAWLVPVARAAGLRWQGLTFSYVVFRRDGRSLADALPAASVRGARLRIVSDRLVSKGKIEAFVCGTFPREDAAGSSLGEGGRARVRRLDRDASESNAAWGELVRGDLVVAEPGPDPRGRLGKDAAVLPVDAGAPRK